MITLSRCSFILRQSKKFVYILMEFYSKKTPHCPNKIWISASYNKSNTWSGCMYSNVCMAFEPICIVYLAQKPNMYLQLHLRQLCKSLLFFNAEIQINFGTVQILFCHWFTDFWRRRFILHNLTEIFIFMMREFVAGILHFLFKECSDMATNCSVIFSLVVLLLGRA